MTDHYSISEILREFRYFDGKYKKEQIDAALNQKEIIIPDLIKILDKVLKDPHEYTQNTNLYDHIYACMLLGHFRAKEAHNVIADIFSLKDGIPDKLFGDLITEDLPIILLNTCGGSMDRIKFMILDEEIDEYCRISACRALAYSVAANFVSRKEVVEFLGGLLSGNVTDAFSDFRGMLAIVLADLYPVEIIDVIRDAYKNALIMPGFVRLEEIERVLKIGEESSLDSLRKNFEHRSIDDLHKAMSWWACFENKTKKSFYRISENIQNHKRKKKKAASKKKKRKQAKRSRKKNRR